jgi:hypothetical protein
MNVLIAYVTFLVLCLSALWLFLRILVALPSQSQPNYNDDVVLSDRGLQSTLHISFTGVFSQQYGYINHAIRGVFDKVSS